MCTHNGKLYSAKHFGKEKLSCISQCAVWLVCFACAHSHPTHVSKLRGVFIKCSLHDRLVHTNRHEFARQGKCRSRSTRVLHTCNMHLKSIKAIWRHAISLRIIGTAATNNEPNANEKEINEINAETETEVGNW